MKRPCIYCGQDEGTTRDHIPPKCLFPKPCPNIALITVPCCEPCRRRDEINDALVRDLLISTREAEPHQAVQSQLASARNRSFKRPSQLRAVLRHMTQADVHSPGGIYLRSAPAFNLDSLVMDSFFERVARGLLHEERRCGFVSCTTQWSRSRDPVICTNFAREGRSRAIGDVFSYSVRFLEGHLASIWLLTFYDRLPFFIHLKPSVA
jgi:hypothetical protein